MKYRKNSGFTLVELMIAVAIVGIIMMIAVPSYQSQIMKSDRNDALNQLLKLQMQQESWRLENNSYANIAQLGNPSHDFYTFSVANVTATTFTITATAKGRQTDDTGCTILSIDQSMTRAPASCW